MEKKLTDIDTITLESEYEIIYNTYSNSNKTQADKDILVSDFEKLLNKYSNKVKTEFVEYNPIIQ